MLSMTRVELVTPYIKVTDDCHRRMRTVVAWPRFKRSSTLSPGFFFFLLSLLSRACRPERLSILVMHDELTA